MRDVLTKMGKHGLAFAVGLMLTRLVGFIIMGPLTRALEKADYGIADNLALAASLVMMIAAQGVPSGLFRAYAYSANSVDEKRRVIATAFRYTLVSSVAMALVIGAGAMPFSRSVTGSSDYWPLVVFVLLTYLFANLKNICFQILRADYRSKEFLIVSCSEFLLCAGLNIWFVVFLHLGPAGMVYSNLIGAGVAVLLAVRFVPQAIGEGFDSTRAREMVSFGLPLVPQAILIFVLNSSDRFLLVHLLGEQQGLQASGLYGRSAQFASILDGVLLMPFMMFWPSVYYEVAKRKTAAQDLGRCATYYVVVAAFLALGLSAVAHPLVIAMIDRGYHDAWKAIPPLAFALVCFGLSDVTKVGLMVSGATRTMPFFVAGAAATSMVLNYLLIPRIGVMGAAWSQLGAYASLAVLVGIGSYRRFRVDYEWGRLVRVAIATGILLVAVLRWPLALEPTKSELVFDVVRRGAAVALAYPLVLVLTGFFTARERELAIGYARRWFGRTPPP